MYDRKLRFYPKYMDMCKNNPNKVKKIIKIIDMIYILWLILGVCIMYDMGTEINFSELDIGTIFSLFFHLNLYLFQIIFFLTVKDELNYGVNYFKQKKDKDYEKQ